MAKAKVKWKLPSAPPLCQYHGRDTNWFIRYSTKSQYTLCTSYAGALIAQYQVQCSTAVPIDSIAVVVNECFYIEVVFDKNTDIKI